MGEAFRVGAKDRDLKEMMDRFDAINAYAQSFSKCVPEAVLERDTVLVPTGFRFRQVKPNGRRGEEHLRPVRGGGRLCKCFTNAYERLRDHGDWREDTCERLLQGLGRAPSWRGRGTPGAPRPWGTHRCRHTRDGQPVQLLRQPWSSDIQTTSTCAH